MGYGVILLAIFSSLALVVFLVFQSRERLILMVEDHGLMGKIAERKDSFGNDSVFLYKEGDSCIEIVGEFSGDKIEINHSNLQNARHVKLVYLMKIIYCN